MSLFNKSKYLKTFKHYLYQSRRNESAIYVFDRKAKNLQRTRAAFAQEVKIYDYLKDEIGFRVADRVFDIKRKFKLAADIGCGRGYVAKHISADSIEEIILCDMNAANLENVKVGEGVKTKKVILDEEYIQLEPNSLDLVISSLSLHWVNNLPQAFKNILNCLKQDGVFIASVFGCDSLYELRTSLQLAELERLGGFSPHISPFTQVRDIGNLLTRAGFTMLTIDTDEIIVNYPSMFDLMWDLKGMGENNAVLNRSLHLRREAQFAAAAIYEELYGKKDEKSGTFSVPASFQIINMLGWRPHPQQPKPLERGTGEVSLKDIFKLNGIVNNATETSHDDNKKN